MKTAQSKVEQANALHAEALAKKKEESEWWGEAHKATEEFYAASKALAAEGRSCVHNKTLVDWLEAHAKLQRYSNANAPHGEHTAGENWWKAKNDALAALAAEAGLITKMDIG